MLSIGGQEDGSLVVLDSVQYAQQGTWAVNLWFKATDVQGNGNESLFYHAAAGIDTSSFDPNQVRRSEGVQHSRMRKDVHG